MTDLPTTMTAIGIKEPGGPEVLVPEQRPVPVPLYDWVSMTRRVAACPDGREAILAT